MSSFTWSIEQRSWSLRRSPGVYLSTVPTRLTSSFTRYRAITPRNSHSFSSGTTMESRYLMCLTQNAGLSASRMLFTDLKLDTRLLISLVPLLIRTNSKSFIWRQGRQMRPITLPLRSIVYFLLKVSWRPSSSYCNEEPWRNAFMVPTSTAFFGKSINLQVWWWFDRS